MKGSTRALLSAVLAPALIAAASGCGDKKPRTPPAPRIVPLTDEAAFDGEADVSPDSAFVVFSSARNGERDLFRLDTATGRTAPLTRTPEDESEPAVSSDGRIAYIRGESRGSSLWTMEGDGAGARELAADTSGFSSPTWSPHADTLLLVSAGRGFVVVPVTGSTDAPPHPGTAVDPGFPAGWDLPEGAGQPYWGSGGIVVFRAGEPDSAGDLYAYRPGRGEPARRLTRTAWDERDPYLREGQLAYAADPEGVYRIHLTRWLPEGGDAGTVELGTERRDARGPALWPGGRSVIYSETGAWAIRTAPVTHGEPTTVVPPISGNFGPVFDTDARNIYFTSDRDGNEDVYVVDLSDLNVANLTTNLGPDYDPDYSPDLHRLVFATVREGTHEILSIDQSGLDEVVIASDAGEDREPRFSPDGSRVAFVSNRGGSADIWIVDSAGGEPVRLTRNDKGGEYSPAWVQDGAFVVFEADWTGRETLWKIAAAGGEAVPVTADSTAGSWDAHPSASMDGTHVVFSRVRRDDPDIWILNLETGAATPLTTDPKAREDRPSLSRDGNTVTYQSGGAVNLFRRYLPAGAGGA